MTRHEAKRQHKPPGYAIRLAQHEGLQLYLADWSRRPEAATTPIPGSARYFERAAEAADVARLLDVVTGQKWMATTVPDAEPDLTEIAFRQAFADAFGELLGSPSDVFDCDLAFKSIGRAASDEYVWTAYGTFRLEQEGGRP